MGLWNSANLGSFYIGLFQPTRPCLVSILQCVKRLLGKDGKQTGKWGSFLLGLFRYLLATALSSSHLICMCPETPAYTQGTFSPSILSLSYSDRFLRSLDQFLKSWYRIRMFGSYLRICAPIQLGTHGHTAGSGSPLGYPDTLPSLFG